MFVVHQGWTGGVERGSSTTGPITAGRQGRQEGLGKDEGVTEEAVWLAEIAYQRLRNELAELLRQRAEGRRAAPATISSATAPIRPATTSD
ncbi:hypothetical protein ACFQV8_24885 [Pseudonocardia benzenivorans]